MRIGIWERTNKSVKLYGKERSKKRGDKEQEVLGRTNRLLSLIRHGPH
jgi:hypothetical protein